ncbi:MAG: hypothetical protein AAGJ28_10215 [Pseudomonadota bacterium]
MRLYDALLAAALSIAPQGAEADVFGVDKVKLPAGMSMPACVERAKSAMADAGLSVILVTEGAVGGKSLEINKATIVCLPESGMAMVSVNAPSDAPYTDTWQAMSDAMEAQ